MIVYGDILFIENMIIGWVLLYLTGEICGRSTAGRRAGDRGKNVPLIRAHTYKCRLFAGSAMCGAFSLVIFLNAKAPLMLLMEAVFAVAVCRVTFGAWRNAVTFILVTYFMGGVTMGLLLLTKQQGIYTAVGIYSGDMKAAALAVFIALGYSTAMQITRTVRKTKLYKENSYDVTICCGERTIETKAFLDTGNHLKDPVSGKPVAVASERLWHEIQMLVPEKDVASMDFSYSSKLVLIPYETLGSKGVLEGIRADYADVGERRIDGCIIARGIGQFAMGGRSYGTGKDTGWELLISAEMADARLHRQTEFEVTGKGKRNDKDREIEGTYAMDKEEIVTAQE